MDKNQWLERKAIVLKNLFVVLLSLVLAGTDFLGWIGQIQAEDVPIPPVVINEMMWMGSSLSSYDEWLELKNTGGNPVDLSGWYFTRRSMGNETMMVAIPAGKIIDDFFVISNYSLESEKTSLVFTPDLVDSAISLNNSDLQIKLYNNLGEFVDAADDGQGRPQAGEYTAGQVWQSMERNSRIEDGTLETSWHSSSLSLGFKENLPEKGTPRQENANLPPVAEAGNDQQATLGEPVFFDASDSFDPEGGDLIYSWDFGDGENGEGITPTHIYGKEGDYAVSLTVSDGYSQTIDGISVQVLKKTEYPVSPPPDQPKEPAETDKNDQEIVYDYSDRIIFNEIFPNPQGEDKELEFIELYNDESRKISLKGWQITGGTNPYVFKEDAYIVSQGFLVLKYETTKIYLKNSGQSLSLLDPKGKIISQVEYGQAKENQSWALAAANQWAWSLKVTEGKKNEILAEEELVKETEEINKEEEEEEIEVTKIVEMDLSQARNLDLNQEVRVKGFVAVEPGVFGTQYFYLFDGQAGLKVYSNKKQFPKLKIGDRIEVTGKLAEGSGERKINVSDKTAISKLSNATFPSALRLSLNQINENAVGSLIIVEGEILDAAQGKIILGSQAGDLEVYLKRGTGLKSGDYEAGQQATVLGILVPYNEDYRLLPRAKTDVRIAEVTVSGDSANEMGQVLGVTSRQPVELSENEQKNNQKIYLWLISAGLVLGLIFYLYRWWREKRLNQQDPSE